ncbi:MAG: hypothetical protein A2672_00830 [Candidatus Wildermuthbacteria bacterium RIFCSPHIGHO2_01_FULL_49_22b]|uniref:Uncharacterized protein n=1 Tax=Candidatus Wildermuthbacteria bacterium RIFCSPHIGHO2_01_FULL_49_22b TaxID=1802448 RepID=A0A1G2QXU4_9BACT|nr:MAG: hypothetical protein A2672_00830 [Candidatus Wildermuthbacteria bacterium RIFCSPHIGHO2_01_FULL_49_22b]
MKMDGAPEIGQPRSSETEQLIEKRGMSLSKEKLDWYSSTFEVNGRQVENLGVYHDPTALKEYRKEIEEAIKRASVVVLEDAPTASGEYSDEYVDQMLKEAESKGIQLSKDKVILELDNQTGKHFFRVIEDIAAREGKPVAVVDPNSSDRTNEHGKQERQRVRSTNNAIELTKLGAFLAAVAGIVGPEVIGRKKETAQWIIRHKQWAVARSSNV